jgi:hypothetical protein
MLSLVNVPVNVKPTNQPIAVVLLLGYDVIGVGLLNWWWWWWLNSTKGVSKKVTIITSSTSKLGKS